MTTIVRTWESFIYEVCISFLYQGHSYLSLTLNNDVNRKTWPFNHDLLLKHFVHAVDLHHIMTTKYADDWMNKLTLKAG